ncbi:MAG: hypothetical protein HYU39_01810 [Thaumarchaeota archaeon]|nr:hypothetical protein [Nitrososphaerota archaeon]
MKIAVCLVAARKYYPESEIEARRRHIESFASKETTIELVFPDEGNYWVDKPTEFDTVYLKAYIVKRIVEAEKQGFDAALVNCIIDPGVDESRCVVNIPVLGPGRTSMHIASMLADKAGFFCPAALVPHLHRFAKTYDMEQTVGYVEPVDLGPTAFSDKKKAIREAFLTFAQRAIDAGAQALIPWGLPLLSAGGLRAQELSKELGIPVIDPHIYVKVAESLVEMGLSQSRKAYPAPPEKQIDGLLKSMK